MAGGINAIDITQRAFEIVTGTQPDDAERIRSALTKISAVEQPRIPTAATEFAPASVLPAQVQSLPLNSSTAALSHEEITARFGIGHEFDVTVGLPVPNPRAQQAPPVAIEPTAAPLSAAPAPAPTVAPEITQTPLTLPTVDARQTAALLETGPDAQARRSEQLAGLAGLATNSPAPPRPFAANFSPTVAPIVIDSLGGSAAVRSRGMRVTVRSAATGNSAGAPPSSAAVTARQIFEQSLGIGVFLDLAA